MSINKTQEHIFAHTDTVKIAIEIDDYENVILKANMTVYYDDTESTIRIASSRGLDENGVDQLVNMLSDSLKEKLYKII